jgi:hypothetical protein
MAGWEEPSSTPGAGIVVVAATAAGVAVAAAETVGAGTAAALATAAGAATTAVATDGAGIDAVAATAMGAADTDVAGEGTVAVAPTTAGVAVALAADEVGAMTRRRPCLHDKGGPSSVVVPEPPVKTLPLPE